MNKWITVECHPHEVVQYCEELEKEEWVIFSAIPCKGQEGDLIIIASMDLKKWEKLQEVKKKEIKQ